MHTGKAGKGIIFNLALVILMDLCVALMCFSVIYLCASPPQTTWPPDRKSPSGCTIALLPKPYIPHSYKLKQSEPLSMLPCVVFLVLSLALICRVHQILAAVFFSDSNLFVVFACGCCVHMFWSLLISHRMSILSCGLNCLFPINDISISFRLECPRQ